MKIEKMLPMSICFIVILSATIDMCRPHVAPAQLERVPDKSWDFLIFTQEWPQSACIDYKGNSSQRACEIFNNVTTWTVHGVWPTKAGTRGPYHCQKLPFDLSKLIQLEPNLLEFWPNIFAGRSVYSLWKHEWTKHGTCAVELPSIGDERDYFALGLSWLARYQMLAVLSAGGVRPGSAAYSWEQIRAALSAHFSRHMVVDCVKDKETKRWYLSQIKLCLDKTFALTDCHHKLEPITTGCPKEGILYPQIEPTPVAARTELEERVEVVLLSGDEHADPAAGSYQV